ncbi:MAG: DUF4393 domain-containing protein [Nitrospirae bacterium]|nr:DUF4393 domain-containing protein [Nitrospirota bacterium]
MAFTIYLNLNMDDSAKEIAKTTAKALEVAEKVGGFVATILGEACKELGASIHDWAKFYRYRNLLKIQHKIIQIQREKNIEGKSIPIQLSIGIPLIEAASVVEDDFLQQKWAALIVNATDTNKEEVVRKSFVDILSSMDSTDALVLDWLSSQGWNNTLGNITTNEIAEKINIDETEARISMSNLNRLGLIDFGVPTTVGTIDISLSSQETRVRLSYLGWNLVDACKV